jgi:hypothetical protein
MSGWMTESRVPRSSSPDFTRSIRSHFSVVGQKAVMTRTRSCRRSRSAFSWKHLAPALSEPTMAKSCALGLMVWRRNLRPEVAEKDDFVNLVYRGENHGLKRKENQVDYHYRIIEWLDHYLNNAEAPKWITEGKNHLERQKELDAKKKATKAKGKAEPKA